MMQQLKMLGFLWMLGVALLVSSPLLAQEAPDAAKAPEPSTLTVLVKPLDAFKGMADVDKLTEFLVGFIARDPRYTVTRDATATASLVVSVAFSRTPKGIGVALSTDTVGIRQQSHKAELTGRPTLTSLQAEIARGIRLTMDYSPAQQTALVRILGTAAEGDAYGELVEDAVFAAVQKDYRRSEATAPKLPIADANIPALMKGDPKLLETIRDAGIALLVVGTVNVPQTKDIGGATQNLYRGKAVVALRVWDLERRQPLAYIDLELNGEGAFSDLVYRLFDGAAARSAEMVRQDLGYPKE